MAIYKKFVIIFLSLVLLSLISVGAINYYVDPANQFFLSQSFDEKIADASLANKIVMLRSNYNERAFKKLMLARLPIKPDVLVLGSSRVMSINHTLLKSNSFYNAYVTNPAATMEDDIAFYYLYQKRDWKPKTVIIGLDAWILDKKLGWEGWKAVQPEYTAGKRLFMGTHETTRRFEKMQSFFEKYSQLLSFDYLKASILHKSLYLQPGEKKHDDAMNHDILISSNGNDCPTCDLIYPDGSRMPSQKKELMTADEINALSKNTIQHLEHDNSYTELDPEYMHIFEQFISYLSNQKINVVLYLPPYAPMAYDEMQKDKNYQMVNAAEKYFRSIASKYHLKIIGSYNPSVLGLKANHFSDPTHLKKEGFEIIFNRSNSAL